VVDILAALGVKETTPVIEVWNKLDLLTPAARDGLLPIREGVFPLSALTGDGIGPLLAAISRVFDEAKSDRMLTLSFADGRKRAWLHAEGVVTAEEETDDGHRLAVRWTARQERRYREL
jgi:GTP-binding protein HflX